MTPFPTHGKQHRRHAFRRAETDPRNLIDPKFLLELKNSKRNKPSRDSVELLASWEGPENVRCDSRAAERATCNARCMRLTLCHVGFCSFGTFDRARRHRFGPRRCCAPL